MLETPDSKTIEVVVAGSSVFGRYPKISIEKTYNMFLSDGWLVDYAGWQRSYEFQAQGQGRGLFRSARKNIAVAVVNNVVYLLTPVVAPPYNTVSSTPIGFLQTGVGEVFMDENLNQQICIVDGLYAYIYNYDLGANLTMQTSVSEVFNPTYVCFHNGFFLFGNGNSVTDSLWYVYQYDTQTTISLNSSFPLETKPDNPQAVKRVPGQGSNVLVLGSVVAEVWNQVGGIQNYRKNSSFNIDYGCLSLETIAANDQYIVWLAVNEANSPVIMVYTGQSYESISTDGIDYLMDSLEFPQDSTAFFHTLDGHLLYVLTFYNPADNLTIMYDFTTQKFFNLTDANSNYFPARQVIYFNLQTFFISLNNGSLYNLSTNFTNYDENIYNTIEDSQNPPDTNLIHEIPRVRVCNTVRAPESARFIANLVSFVIEQGVSTGPPEQDCIIWLITEDDIRIFSEPGTMLGPNSVQMVPEGHGDEDCESYNYRPAVDCSISKDGGETWSNYVRRYLNPIGYRKNILKWERLGQANEITTKFKFWGVGRFVAGNGGMQVR